MTAKGIITAAYQAGIVPEHLYGKTQWKTLAARLSEDILVERENSLFYRTEPGVFFIAEYLTDPDISDHYKARFPARRRTRDLQTEPFLAIEESFLESYQTLGDHDWESLLQGAVAGGALRYCEAKSKPERALAVWTFSVVRRENEVLSYRSGRYREDRDSFANKRTVGFPGVVRRSDFTLFSEGDYGVRENALSTISSDLNISPVFFFDKTLEPPKPLSVSKVNRRTNEWVLMVIMDWKCPNWLEPTTRRLSINDPTWVDISVRPNHEDDFEPWSLAAIETVRQHIDRT